MKSSQKYHSFIYNSAETKSDIASFCIEIKLKDESNEILFLLVSLKAPQDHHQDIVLHLKKVASKYYFTNQLKDQKMRIIQTAKHIRAVILELQKYYQSVQKPFYIEAAMVSNVHGHFNVSHNHGISLYTQHNGSFSKVVNVKNNSSQTKFVTYTFSAQDSKCIIVCSSEMSSELTYHLLKTYVLTDNSDFDIFSRKIQSLKNPAVMVFVLQDNSDILISNSEDTEIEKKNRVNLVTKIVGLIRNISYKLPKLPNIGKNKTKNTSSKNKLSANLKKSWTSLWSRYINPNPIWSLITFVIIVGSILVLAGYFVFFNPQDSKLIEKANQIEQTINVASQKAESQDTVLAEEKLNEAKNTIASLSAEQKESLNTLAKSGKVVSLSELETKIQSVEDSLSNTIRIPAEKIYSSAPESDTMYSLVTTIGSVTYIVDKKNAQVLSIAKNNTPKTLARNEDLAKSIDITFDQASSTLYILTSDNTVLAMNSTGAITKQNNPSQVWPAANAFAFYAKSMYLLSADENSITKYPKATAGFGAKQNYTSNSLASNTLKDALSLTINGNVFVLLSGSEIVMFNKGIQKEFNVKNIKNYQTATQRLQYINSPDRLILQNSERKSFIILRLSDNSAEYEKEIIVNNTTSINSFNYDESTKNVFFTSNNSLFKLSIP